MINKITSRENKILKTARSLHRKKGRLQSGLYFAEGARITNEAISYASDRLKFVIVSQSYSLANFDYIDNLDKSGKEVYITEDKLFEDICDTETPQGIAAVLEIPKEEEPDFSTMKYVLILDGVSEPGNVGTIIRTAEAAGIELVCLINGCADVYSPKVVRSAMGSLFRTRFIHTTKDVLSRLKADGFTVASTALYNSIPIENANIYGSRAVVIGSEARGVSEEVLKMSDMAVRIGMCGKVESLNAAVAAGIAMYTLKPR